MLLWLRKIILGQIEIRKGPNTQADPGIQKEADSLMQPPIYEEGPGWKGCVFTIKMPPPKPCTCKDHPDQVDQHAEREPNRSWQALDP